MSWKLPRMWLQQREPREAGPGRATWGTGGRHGVGGPDVPCGGPAARGLRVAVGWRGGSRAGKGCGAAARPRQMQGSAEHENRRVLNTKVDDSFALEKVESNYLLVSSGSR